MDTAALVEVEGLGERYEVSATAAWVVARGWTRVALQFPDAMLGDAAAVGRLLQTALDGSSAAPVQLYVCADTTFASCCVDEVRRPSIDAASLA
jgi:diphthamide biosynthesis protein 2